MEEGKINGIIDKVIIIIIIIKYSYSQIVIVVLSLRFDDAYFPSDHIG